MCVAQNGLKTPTFLMGATFFGLTNSLPGSYNVIERKDDSIKLVASSSHL